MISEFLNMPGGGRVCGKAALQLWCRLELASYPGLEVTNMSSDWRSGRAFCALIHRFRPDILDWSKVSSEEDPEHWRRSGKMIFVVLIFNYYCGSFYASRFSMNPLIYFCENFNYPHMSRQKMSQLFSL